MGAQRQDGRPPSPTADFDERIARVEEEVAELHKELVALVAEREAGSGRLKPPKQ